MAYRKTCAFLLALALSSFALAEAAKLDLFVERQPTAKEIQANFSGARLEPAYGCYLGAYIDLDSDLRETYQDMTGKVRRLPGQFEQIVGKEHASYFFYLGYGRPAPVDWISTLGMQGKIVHIAFEPNRGLQYVLDDKYLNQLAEDLAVTGSRIFLRFASEMNGPWTSYHGDPALYKQKFQLVAKVMHEKAPNVAMVWCPYTTPTNPIPDYYPGDAAVDWVGVNLYSVTYHNQDWSQPASHIPPTQKLDYIYARYSARKPIMIGEFGATHYSSLEKKNVAGFAQRSIGSLYTSLPRKYPRVKCINYFNSNNMEVEHRLNNNYAVTHEPSVLKTYRKAVEPAYFIPDGGPLIMANVDPAMPSAALPAPMPIRGGQRFGGKEITFSAWIKSHDPGVEVSFLLDGKPFYTGSTPTDWAVTLFTDRVSAGEHEILAIARKNGKELTRSRARFTVVK